MIFLTSKKNNNSKRDAMTIRIRRATLILSGIGTCMLLLALSSCYTILRHPRITRAGHQRPDNNRCFDCHTDEEIYYYHQPMTLGRPPVDWDDALYTPWWYDMYWSEDDPQGSRYRETFRPGGLKSIGPAGRIRSITPSPVEPPQPSLKVETDQDDSDEKKKDDTPASEKRQLRPEKKKKKKDE